MDKWAAVEDPKQLDRVLLEFPLELRTQLLELQRLHQILNIQQVSQAVLTHSQDCSLSRSPLVPPQMQQSPVILS